LLARFGSIQHIAAAEPGTLVSSIPGIGPDLARRILEHLEGVTG
jgi:ERCC4-type nuclease